MQFAEPLAIRDVDLAAWDVLHVSGDDELHVDAAFFEDFVDRDPIDTLCMASSKIREHFARVPRSC